MKKEQREIYVLLTDEVNYQLCTFCRFGHSFQCGELECKHPLQERLVPFNVYNYSWPEPGDDCWGFRPTHKVEVVADIVGIILANGWEVAGWSENEDGVLEVSGSKEWLV